MGFKGKITLVKRWMKMAVGRNSVAVKQGIGKCYSIDDIEGYYNDLTGKISGNTLLDENGIPVNIIEGNKKVYFPISIFQYALGLWDLYLMSKEDEYKNHFLKICNWVLENQKEDGSWDCFSPIGYKKLTVSSMGQGEAVSVLIRAYKLTGEEEWLYSSKKAINFMITEVKDGGTMKKDDDNTVFEEYAGIDSDKKSVLNGWIFSLFGIYDYLKVVKDETIYQIFTNSVNSLVNNLQYYDCGYWSLYDRNGRLASPAYHDLHIALLNAMYTITGYKQFLNYAQKWEKYKNSRIGKLKAFFKKIVQKLGDNPEGIVVQ